MGCCKCEEYKWPDPQEVVWTDPADGKGYCVFHAPKDKKHVSMESFNKLVLERIGASARRSHSAIDCHFTGAIFPYTVRASFQYTYFEKVSLDFSHCHFHGCLYVYTTTNNITFKDTVFYDEFLIYNANIRNLYFENCIFFMDMSIEKSKILSLFLSRSKFSRTTQFNDTIIGGSSDKHNNVPSSTSICDCVFEQGCTISKITLFSALELIGNITKHNKVVIQELDKATLEKITFYAADVQYLSVYDCKLPDRLGLELQGVGALTEYSKNEDLYRAMKQKALDSHDQGQASRWHFREKLMALKRGGNGIFEAVMLWLYWATSGFGERAVRAGVWLVALVALSFVLNATTQPMDWNSMWGATAANATLATIPFAKDIPGDGWVKVGRGLWQFLIAVQFTLFALAVRNRFRR